MKSVMPFSWKAVLLAPLVTPVIVTAILSAHRSGHLTDNPLGILASSFVACSLLSYGATVCLLLPTLFAVSRFARR